MARNFFLSVGNLEQSPSATTLDSNASFPFYRGFRPTLYTSQEMVSGLPTRSIRKGVSGVRELTEVSACNLPREGCMPSGHVRSEEHTSELQSRLHLVCRLLLEKKNNAAWCINNAMCSSQSPNESAAMCNP